MAEDVAIHVHLEPISLDSQNLSPALVLDWLARLQWWQWLLLLKVGLVFWVFNVTVILPSLYMQVMLYTDEMTSRQNLTESLLGEWTHLVTWALARYSAIQKEKELKQYWLDKIERHYNQLHRKRRRKIR